MASQSNVSKAARVVAGVLKKAVNDKNPTVVLQGLQLLECVLQLTDEQGRKVEVKGVFDATLVGIIAKLAEGNKRVHEECSRELLSLAAHQVRTAPRGTAALRIPTPAWCRASAQAPPSLRPQLTRGMRERRGADVRGWRSSCSSRPRTRARSSKRCRRASSFCANLSTHTRLRRRWG